MGAYTFFRRKKFEWEDKLFIHQRRSFFDWTKSKGVMRNERVLVYLFEEPEYFFLDNGKWKKSRGQSANTEGIRFALCQTGFFSEKLVVSSQGNTKWQNIFKSQFLEVWENREFYEKNNLLLPLRLEMSREEKQLILTEARRMIQDVLVGKEPKISDLLSHRFDGKQDLDVALWVNGKIRASVIITGKSFREALEVAARRANKDFRFLPITLDELPQTRIEVTLMSDLVLPLLWKEFKKNEIDPIKGYMVSFEEKRGWYLPEVHNVVTFTSLENLLFRLKSEKTLISEDIEHWNYGQFEVMDWIESQNGFLELSGPVPRVEREETFESTIQEVCDSAIHWLLRHQDDDGSIPHIFSSIGGVTSENTTVLGCVGHALGVYGKNLQNGDVIRASRKIQVFLKENLDRNTKNNRTDLLLEKIYYFRLCLVLHEEVSGQDINDFFESSKKFKEDTLFWLQMLSLLADYSEKDKGVFIGILLEETATVYRNFQKKKDLPETQLACYPELIAVLKKLFDITNDKKWKDQAIEMLMWYIHMQKNDGSFPYSPGRIFAYIRGTGKIFEVLALFPEESRESLEKTLYWIESMQYDNENTFWTSFEAIENLIGGFRHDAFNREAWSDAAAHVILGCARILINKK